jgi:tyrosine aminotransferase
MRPCIHTLRRMSTKAGWNVEKSQTAKQTFNPIRSIVDGIKMPPPREDKPVIPLSLGDPTVFGNLLAPQVLVDSIVDNVKKFACNGYVHSAGTEAARAAIAKRESVPGAEISADDVVIASGCSGALDLAIGVLLNPGDNMAVPAPGFALYETLATSKGAGVNFYDLDPARSWEADLGSLESCIDDRTKAILVNNPSNPCGSVYSEEHLRALLEVAERHRIPIIADEIYGNMTFTGHTFHPLASLTDTVPVLSVGGIAKEFLVPGWRLGWVLIHNKGGVFDEVKEGLFDMSQLTLGASSLVQSAVPSIMDPAAGSEEAASLEQFTKDTNATLEDHAEFTVERLSGLPGLQVVVPQGAMYVMIGIDPEAFDESITDDTTFCQALLEEEYVFMLPGQCFRMPNFARVVFSAPKDKLADAYDRIEAFVRRHHVGQ